METRQRRRAAEPVVKVEPVATKSTKPPAKRKAAAKPARGAVGDLKATITELRAENKRLKRRKNANPRIQASLETALENADALEVKLSDARSLVSE